MRRFSAPRNEFTAATLADVPAAIASAEAGAARGLHAVGFVSYDAAASFDPAFAGSAPCSLPCAWFGLFDEPELVELSPIDDDPPLVWECDVAQDEHARAVATIREMIARGDVYQVNYTAHTSTWGVTASPPRPPSCSSLGGRTRCRRGR